MILENGVEVRDIPGFAFRYGIGSNGLLYSKIRKRFIKSFRNPGCNRLWNRLKRDDGVRKNLMLNRIVAQVFIKPDLNLGHLVMFIDDDIENCRPENLFIMTRAEHKRFYYYYEGSMQEYVNYLTVHRSAA